MKYKKYFIIIGAVIVLFCFLTAFKNSSACKCTKYFVSLNENKNSNDSNPCFLVISDIHLDYTKKNEKDTPKDLWDVTKAKIEKILSGKDQFVQPKFIVVLGDLPAHELSSADRKKDIDIVLSDLKGIADYYGVPIFYLPGNNDSWKGDYCAFSNNIFSSDTSLHTILPLFKTKSVDPAIKIINDSLWKNIGCYSAYPLSKNNSQPRLRLIALNSTIFTKAYADSEGIAKQQDDAEKEIVWLSNQLNSASNKHEFVLIAMHVPPGINEHRNHQGQNFPFWNTDKVFGNTITIQDTFLNLIEMHKNSIIGVLSSHTHMDGVRKLLDKNDSLVNLLISVPSITTDHGNNTSMKIIYYNPQNFSLNNFITIYSNGKKWETYSFLDIFNNGAACSSMESVIDTMDIGRLQQYVRKIYMADTTGIKYKVYNANSDTSINVYYK
jgi:sphingomyelin phosphodiesterase acid-like 3